MFYTVPVFIATPLNGQLSLPELVQSPPSLVQILSEPHRIFFIKLLCLRAFGTLAGLGARFSSAPINWSAVAFPGALRFPERLERWERADDQA